MNIFEKNVDGGVNASVNEGEIKINFWKTVSSYFYNIIILF